MNNKNKKIIAIGTSACLLALNIPCNTSALENSIVEEESKVNKDNQTTISSNNIAVKEVPEIKGHSVAGIIIEAEPIDEVVTGTEPSTDNSSSTDNKDNYNNSNIEPIKKPQTSDTFGVYLSTLIVSTLGLIFINRKNKKQAL